MGFGSLAVLKRQHAGVSESRTVSVDTNNAQMVAVTQAIVQEPAGDQSQIKDDEAHGHRRPHSLFGVHQLKLFGSWARSSAGPQSDVDVLVDFEAPSATGTMED